jgi:hypothetical protein
LFSKRDDDEPSKNLLSCAESFIKILGMLIDFNEDGGKKKAKKGKKSAGN